MLGRIDRRSGAAIRRRVDRSAALHRAAPFVARAMSPSFRALVAVLVATRGTRKVGLTSLAASVAAALIAKALRDHLGRTRPGTRAEAGFPSRHSAASVAIAVAVASQHRRAGQALGGVAILGMAARVAAAEHELADVIVGAALGWAVAASVARALPPSVLDRLA